MAESSSRLSSSSNRRPLFAGEIVESRDYSALCGICYEWYSLMSVSPELRSDGVRLKKIMKAEGWKESPVAGWCCPTCTKGA